MTTFNNKQFISDIAQQNIVMCEASLSIREAALLMRNRRCGSIVVVKNEKPIGIWTEIEALKINFDDKGVFDQAITTVMNRQINTAAATLKISQAALKFKIYSTTHLIVLNPDDSMFGIVSQSDVVINQDANNFLTIIKIGAVKSSNACIESVATISEAVGLMRRYQCDALIVLTNKKAKGVVTTRDLLRAISLNQTHDCVSSIMSNSIISAPITLNLLDARALMMKENIRHLAIENAQGMVCQLISFSDILAKIDQCYSARLHASIEHKELELRICERHLYMADTVINASSNGILMTDEHGVIVSINAAFTTLTGYTKEEAIGQPSTLTSSGKHGKEFYQQMWQQISEKGMWMGEIWNRRKSGEIYPEWLTINKVIDPCSGSIMYSGVFSDVSEAKNSEKIIENLAYYDPLTKLPNRQLFLDRLEFAINSCQSQTPKLAVLLIDIDGFKQINDSLGHTAGDSLLKKVSTRLRDRVPSGCTLARIGGDEFVLLFNCKDINQVSYQAQSLLDLMAKPIIENDTEFFISLSIGCVMYPNDGRTKSHLIQNAETALDRAKSQGTNSFRLYSPDMSEQFKDRLILEQQLRGALKRQEFHLLYQPKVMLETGKIAGVEALIRWDNPVLGRIPPDQFIYLAENLGIIPDIGLWVLQEAIKQSVHWQGLAQQPFITSINVSAKQFVGQNLVEQVIQATEKSGLDPKVLDLEVTETSLMDNLDLVTMNLRKLREIGVQVSIDDFGTGYSSLSKLNELPLDTLKIDRSFVSSVPGNQEAEALISTIVFLAHKLNLKVVAEGVEEESQIEFLRQLKCEQIQGYYYSRPVSAQKISEILERNEI